jgi:hypothetical protein
MQVYHADKSNAAIHPAPGGKNQGQASLFARQFDQMLEKSAYGQSAKARQPVHLGTITRDQPTVSHLLADHQSYGSECWEIIHSGQNHNKPYTRIPEGTEIFLDPQTREITWHGDHVPGHDGRTRPGAGATACQAYGSGGAPGSNLPGDQRRVIEDAIDLAAQRHNMPRDLIAGVIRAESDFNPSAVSAAGARGLMQLMPETARELGVENSFDIRENIDAGTRYLKKMLHLFGDNLEKALSAYNAGPGAVQRFNGRVPYDETRQYVARVMSFIQ